MAIIKKSDLQRHLNELETRSARLRSAITGSEPNPNIYAQYSNDPEQYRNEFTEVDLTDVEYALDDFRTVLKRLEFLKKLDAPKLKGGE